MAEPLGEVRRQFGIPLEDPLIHSAEERWCGPLGPVGGRAIPDIAKEGIVKFD